MTEGHTPGSLADLLDLWDQRITAGKQAGLYTLFRPVEGPVGRNAQVGGRELLMPAGYSYLDLNRHPAVQRAAAEALERYGTSSAAARIVAGTTPLHVELEEELARFKGTEDALVLSNGYLTNIAAIAALCGPSDLVITDKLNHASIIDGCRLSGAHVRQFNHNDMEKLERILGETDGHSTRLIVVDGIFSMDGDLANLLEIVSLARRYGAPTMVDEAHSIGVLGPEGRGIDFHFGLQGQLDLVMGTLTKAIPALGGFLAGSRKLIQFLRHSARPFLLSAALPAPMVAAALAALPLIRSADDRRDQLWRSARRFKEGLGALGFDTLSCESPVVPVRMPDEERTLAMAARLGAEGVFINPVIFPAVARNQCRLRTHITEAHTEADIDQALDAFLVSGRACGVIG